MKETSTSNVLLSGLPGRFASLAAWILLMLAIAPAWAQLDAPVDGEQVTPERIDLLKGEIQRQQDLTQEQKDQALDSLTAAGNALKLAQETRRKTELIQQEARQASQEVQQLRKQLEQLSTQQYQVPESLGSLEEVAQQRDGYKTQLTQAFRTLATFTTALAGLSSPDALSQEIADKQTQIQATRGKVQALADSDLPELVNSAERTRLQAALRLQQAELEQLQARQTTLPARKELLTARRDLAQKKVNLLEPAVQAWQQAYNRAEQIENQRKQEETQVAAQEAARLHPVLEEYANETTQLVALSRELSQERSQLKMPAEQIEDIRSQYRLMQQQVEADLPGDVGQKMRTQRRLLPEVRDLRRQLEQLQTRVDRLQQLREELGQRRDRLKSPSVAAEELTRSIQVQGPRRQRIEAKALELTQDRQEALAALLETPGGKLDQLIDALQTREAQLIELIDVTREYRRFIDENILYIRSMDPVWLPDVQRIAGAIALLADPTAWMNLGTSLTDRARRQPVLMILAVMVLGGLLLLQPYLIKRLRSIDQRVARQYPGRFLDTLWAMLITLGLTVCWPGVPAFVGWQLSLSPQAGQMTYAVGVGLLTASAAWLPVLLLRQVCRREGLGEVHFRWNAEVNRMICRAMLKLSTLGVPLLILVTMGRSHGSVEMEALGRLATIVGLLALAVWTGTLLKTDRAFIQNTLARRKDSWLWRLRKLWIPLVVLIPLALALASGAGYQYTAMQLMKRMLFQAGAIVLLILVNALLLRWVLLGRRRLALATLAKRREAQELKSRQEQEQEPGEAPPEAKEPQIDLSAIGVQTRQFIRYLMAAALLISFWVVWADVLPALQFLDRFVIYAEVTIQSLLLASVLVVLTIVISRNLPGILNITLFQRLQMQTGTQFAVNALIRYIVLVIGLVMAFDAIGIQWGHIQWLVAAMGVGLGFGLQEIFANFVSGLIILVERPIRVGDIITVGQVTGTVTEIRMRATTVTDWDRKELIVPNRDFITTQLVNWTLSDKVIRVVVPVGIAYGSDTAKAHKTLLEVARKNQRILEEPAPTALFVGFGDSSLNFELRAFVGGFRDFLEGTSELHMEIDQAFRKADVEISFPQRDLHIRSVKAAFPVEARQVEKILQQRVQSETPREN